MAVMAFFRFQFQPAFSGNLGSRVAIPGSSCFAIELGLRLLENETRKASPAKTL